MAKTFLHNNRCAEFGQILAKEIKARATSQRWVANSCDVDVSEVSRYIKGERCPSYERALVIASLFYKNDLVLQDQMLATLGYTPHREIALTPEVNAFAAMLANPEVPQAIKMVARTTVLEMCYAIRRQFNV